MTRDNIEEQCRRISANYTSSGVCKFVRGGGVLCFIDASQPQNGTRGIAFMRDKISICFDGGEPIEVFFADIKELHIISSFEDFFADELSLVCEDGEVRISDYSLDKSELKRFIEELIVESEKAREHRAQAEEYAKIIAERLAQSTLREERAPVSETFALPSKKTKTPNAGNEKAKPAEKTVENDFIPEEGVPVIRETVIDIPAVKAVTIPEDYKPAAIPEEKIKWISGSFYTKTHEAHEETPVISVTELPKEESGAAQPVAAQPVVAQPEQPVAAQPATEQPVAAQPVAEQPATEQPVAAQPVVAQPVAEQPVVAQPVAAQPVVAQPEQPVAAQPATEQPVAEQPVAEQPIAEQPVAVQPITELPTEKPLTNEQFMQRVETAAKNPDVFPENKTEIEKVHERNEERELVVLYSRGEGDNGTPPVERLWTAAETQSSDKTENYGINSAQSTAETESETDGELLAQLENMTREETLSFLAESLNEINGFSESADEQRNEEPPETEELDIGIDLKTMSEIAAPPEETNDGKLSIEPIWGDIYIKASRNLRELIEDGRLSMDQIKIELKEKLLSSARAFAEITADSSKVPKVLMPRITELRSAADDFDEYFKSGEDVGVRAMFFMMFQMLSYADRIAETPETKERLNDFFRRFGSAGITLSMLDMRV